METTQTRDTERCRKRRGYAVAAITAEADRACRKYAPFHSMHEGYAITMKELDEAWADIKANRPECVDEMIQVGAMALRFVAELVDWKDE